MKNIAIGILMVILLSILIEPMVETANVLREKIILSTALSNSFRVARDKSLEYDYRREIDAKVNRELFIESFSEAFGNSMNLKLDTKYDNRLIFTSNDEKYNAFTVDIEITEFEENDSGQLVSEVSIRAESKYKFKTKYLKLADNSVVSDFMLKGERNFLMFIRN
ncbi:UNVERIFIED_CONTAM: hypothetical protein Cloal_2549 [Acetivibrio alkalicellulosi]